MTANTDLITNKALEIITQLQNGVMAHGGDAFNLALGVTQMNGIAELIMGIKELALASLGFFAIYLIVTKYWEPAVKKAIKEETYRTDYTDYPDYMSVCLLIGFFSSVMTLAGFFDLTSVWNWIATFNPKLYLAHEIMQKVLG